MICTLYHNIFLPRKFKTNSLRTRLKKKITKTTRTHQNYAFLENPKHQTSQSVFPQSQKFIDKLNVNDLSQFQFLLFR